MTTMTSTFAYKKAAYRETVYGPVLAPKKPLRATIYDTYPEQTQYDKSRAFKRIHFCKELNSYVPADYSFQVRDIRKEVVVEKQTLIQRVFNKQPEVVEMAEESVVVAKGLTHGKMHLVPLEVAQNDKRIRLHGIIGEATPMRCTMAKENDGPKLISLWEAQAQRDIVYRSVLAPRIEKRTKGKRNARKVARK